MSAQQVGTFTAASRDFANVNGPKEVEFLSTPGAWLRVWAAFDAASSSCNYEVMRVDDSGNVEFVKQGTLTGTDRRTGTANSSGNYLSDFVDVNTMHSRPTKVNGKSRWFVGLTSITTATSVVVYGECFAQKGA